jgi:hypothetical protein
MAGQFNSPPFPGSIIDPLGIHRNLPLQYLKETFLSIPDSALFLSRPLIYPGGNLKKRIGKSEEVSYTSLGYGRERGFKGTSR